MNIKQVAAAVVIALGFSGAAHATSSFNSMTVTTDTATNLDVSWVWDWTKATTGGEYSDISSTNWLASAWGYLTSSRRGGNKYVLDIAAGQASIGSYEYDASASTTSPSGVLFHDSTSSNGKTYTLDIVSDPNHSNIWNAHMVASVPEPESYAMFLAGLGLMGVIARRRRTH